MIGPVLHDRRPRARSGAPRLCVGPRPLVLVDGAWGVGVVLDITFGTILSRQRLRVLAGGEAALRLADPGIALEIAGEGTSVVRFLMLAGHSRLLVQASDHHAEVLNL